MRRLVVATLLVALTVGTIAVVAPTPEVSAGQCIFCPQIAIECGPCYNLIPQTCHKCAHCKRIPGCQP